MTRWWQDEVFWRDVGRFLFSPAVWASAAEELDEILELVEAGTGDRILDLGCGTGRHLLPLIAKGYDVVGVEHCAAFRHLVRRRIQQSEVPLDLRAIDILACIEDHIIAAQTSGQRPSPNAVADALELGEYDAVFDIFALIGYHEAPLVDVLLVQTILHLLRPGGWLLVQTREPQLTTGTVKHVDGDGGICVERRRYDRSSRVMTTQWNLHIDGRQRAHQSFVRVYRQTDLRELLEFAGFRDVSAWSSKADECVTVIGRRASG
ncbi:MAG: class I SAM-dependent methyltransferase [Myxococcota bacterium]|nr:class I SAM-dependent methyltransferase [Myxococcota bacterium]